METLDEKGFGLRAHIFGIFFVCRRRVQPQSWPASVIS
jgi:hypothetical protein